MLFVLATALVLPLPAVASEPKRLVVCIVPTDAFSNPTAEFVLETAIRCLKGMRGISPVDPERLYRERALEKQTENLTQVRKLVEEGILAYQNLELDRAVRKLRRALSLYPKSSVIDKSADRNILTRAYSYLGAALLEKAELEKGQQAFATLVAIAPEARLNEKEFPPRIVRVFLGVKQDVLRAERARLSVASVPENARVYVDVAYSCITPCELEVLPGRHILVAAKQGCESRSMVLELESEQQKQVAFTLPEIVDWQKLKRLLLAEAGRLAVSRNPRPSEGLVKALACNGCTEAIVGWVANAGRGSSLRLAMMDLSRGSLKSVESVLLPAPEEQARATVGEAITRLVTAKPGLLRMTNDMFASNNPRTVRDDGGIFTTWWFWTSVAIVATATAVVLGVVLAASSPDKSVLVFEF